MDECPNLEELILVQINTSVILLLIRRMLLGVFFFGSTGEIRSNVEFTDRIFARIDDFWEKDWMSWCWIFRID
jgi:hypothetical protein